MPYQESRKTNITGSEIVQPTDLQSRYSQTIQTHNAVSVAASAWSIPAVWTDCNGFDKIAVTLLNDAQTDSYIALTWSNDGINTHGSDGNALTGTGTQKAGIYDIKARYVKVSVKNNDTVAHTMSAWAMLKV